MDCIAKRRPALNPRIWRLTRSVLIPTVLVGFWLLSLGLARADVVPLTLQTSRPPQPPVWLFGQGGIPKMPMALTRLARAKRAQTQRNWKLCAQNASLDLYALSELNGWVDHLLLTCANRMPKSVAQRLFLTRALGHLEQHPLWLASGPQRAPLRKTMVKAWLILLAYNVKHDHARAWIDIDQLLKQLSYMNRDVKAHLYDLMGRLSFSEQKLAAALQYFQQSLAFEPNDRVTGELTMVQTASETKGKSKSSSGKSVSTPAKSAQAATVNPPVNSESQLVSRIQLSLERGDLLPLAHDTIRLIHKYPGSQQTAWASKQLISGFLELLGKSNPNYKTVRASYLHLMRKADGRRQWRWARLLYNQAYYKDALKLAKDSFSFYQGTAKSASVLSLMAHAALNTDDLGNAKTDFDLLSKQDSGTSEAADALFNLGLMAYQQNHPKQAAAYFERLLISPDVESWEISAHYWLWRSLQMVKSATAQAQAKDQADILMTQFPFSYYGLRARAESGKKLVWKPKKKLFSLKIWQTAGELRSWRRIQLLLRAGCWQEAQAELKNLGPQAIADNKAFLAFYWAAALNYVQATRLINDAWNTDETFRQKPFIELSFPDPFIKRIRESAEKNHINPLLIESLIKQESAYGLRAESPVGALGLMQLMPTTAEGLAQKIGPHSIEIPSDLFQADTNIRLGTFYLANLLSHYDQDVPLGLAAYNVGPSRLDRWLSSRPSLAHLTSLRSSAPQDEVWIDQLPWAETRQYVKAILRNTIIYQSLDHRPVSLANPIWLPMIQVRQPSPARSASG